MQSLIQYLSFKTCPSHHRPPSSYSFLCFFFFKFASISARDIFFSTQTRIQTFFFCPLLAVKGFFCSYQWTESAFIPTRASVVKCDRNYLRLEMQSHDQHMRRVTFAERVVFPTANSGVLSPVCEVGQALLTAQRASWGWWCDSIRTTKELLMDLRTRLCHH